MGDNTDGVGNAEDDQVPCCRNVVLTCTALLCTNWHLLTYLLTPWSRVLLEKLTGFNLVNKFSAFYGTRRFVTALTSARHLSLS